MTRSYSKALLVTTFIISIASGAITNDASKKCPEYLVCNSEGCKLALQKLLENMDLSVDPCDNFYNFACGGFMKTQKIPDDQLQIGVLGNINNLVTEQLHVLLKQPTNKDEPHAFKLTKNFFELCMNTRAIDENNLKSAKKVIGDLGGWPVVDGHSWTENEFDWKKQMYKFRKYGFSVKHFLGTDIQPNSNNSSQRIIIFDEASLPVNRIQVINGLTDPIMQSFYNYLVDLAVIFGANKEEALVQMKESFKLLYRLGKITLPPEDRRNFTATTNIMTIAEVQQRFPHINWIEFINNIIAVPGIEVHENDIVDVGIPKFLNDLEYLLRKTSKRAQANYLMALAVHSISNTLNKAVRDRVFQLAKQTAGIQQPQPRWQECLLETTSKMKVAVAALYARTFFKSDSKSNVETLVSNLQSTMTKMLREVEWMDEETRKEALRKASGIEPTVGYPSELMDDRKVNEFYSQLKQSNDYLDFTINIQKFESDRKFRVLRDPIRRGDWVDYSVSHTVNAFYNLPENTIILPAGILQEEMFAVDRPQAMNYGAVGSIVGHEVTHGFDDLGKQINADGVLKNWWSDNTAIEYYNKAQCIINQYGNYSMLGINLNGVNTQAENIADNGGLKLAYDTYQTWLRNNGQDKCLPNLNYSPDQLFWIAFANAWCTLSRNEYLRQEILTETHSPPYFRVLGMLQNSKNFANDFNCPVGSRMNPVHKCTFW